MADNSASNPNAIWRETWAKHVFAQALLVRSRMGVAMAALTNPQPRHEATKASIDRTLDSIESALAHRHWIRGPLDRWNGTSVELAFQNLHAAKILLVDLLPPDEIDALVPTAVARVATCFNPTDPRRIKVDALPNERNIGKRRAGLKQALELAYGASDELHCRIRGFRNILLATALVMVGFVIGLVIIVRSSPLSMPLCFHPVASAQPGGETTRAVCPSGEDPPTVSASEGRQPDPTDVEIIAGLGLLGGALSAAVAIRKIRGSSTPYDVPIALACLKVPFGALTAVSGILLLGGGFVPGLSDLDSQRQILAYALVFGYAQQLATRLIDDRAQSLLQSVPSKDPEAKQPSAAAEILLSSSRRPQPAHVRLPGMRKSRGRVEPAA